MLKVQGHTPVWLARGSPGFELFKSGKQQPRPAETESARSTYAPIATRGSEVFVVVDNSIRWADVEVLKAAAETAAFRKSNNVKELPQDNAYKVQSAGVLR